MLYTDGKRPEAKRLAALSLWEHTDHGGKWGAISGVVLGVIQIIISLLPLGSLKTILDLLVWRSGFSCSARLFWSP